MPIAVMRSKPNKPETFETIGQWITYNRLAARYSLATLAAEFGKSSTWLSKLESGDIKVKREIVEQIAKLTGADFREGLALLNAAEMSARNPIEYLPVTEQRIVEAYRNANPRQRQMMDLIVEEVLPDGETGDPMSMEEALREAEAEGTIGRRAE